MNDKNQKLRDLAKQSGLNLYSLDHVLKLGRETKDKKLNIGGPDHAYMFSYTSGTTGDPKGVKLTHKMIMSCSSAVNVRFGADKKINSKDTYISYLPAAHTFEQCLFGMAVVTGERVGFYGGDVLKLVEDL